LGDLERALPVADSGRIEAVLARANASAMQLRADTAFLPDRDVLLLVLDQIDAVRRGGAPRAADETHRLLPARTEP
jgi:hypothetical protein